MPSIDLAVDANILIGLSLRADGRTLISDTRLRLLIAEYTFAEFLRHIPGRVQARAQAANLSAAEIALLHASAVGTAETYAFRIMRDSYNRYEGEARRRIPNDPDDWHTAALALAYGAAIWTEDKHFWGCGIAVWTTERLLSHLTAM